MDELIKKHEGLIYIAIKRLFATSDLVEKVAKRHNMDPDDLFQVGRIALWKSLQKFDESKGYKFSTFAVKNIRFTIMTELRLRGHLIHVPANLDINDFPRHYVSGDKVIENGDKQDTLFSVIGSDYDLEGEVMEKATQMENRKKLQRALSDIPLKERNIVILKMQGKTNRVIGERYGVSHQAISIKYRKTMDKLKSNAAYYEKVEVYA